MRLKYKIQHYLTITDRELNYLFFITGLLFFGMLLKYVQQHRVPDYSVQYAMLDSLTAVADNKIGRLESPSLNVDSVALEKETVLQEKSASVVNINAASSDDLTALTGIGPAMGQRIVDYRNQYGRFKTKDELMNVRGIGPKTFDKLKANISL